ncbi:toprim domain-containing protein [Oscillospiraceae bacterium OttesenSCG-928-G22]|nr:toprim domain-containing protein [Oscillospiraceae bacterium OttesenSCG-928-G22]
MAKYTDEQIERANRTDLVSFLQRKGEKLKPSGSEWRWVYRDISGEHDSVTVRSNQWFDQKRQMGGDAIGFLQDCMGLGFREAVRALLNEEPAEAFQREVARKPTPQEDNEKTFKLPATNNNMRRLFAYLVNSRFIAPDVVSHFVRAGALYEEREFHNAVFLGLDEHGVARSGIKKGTLTIGKGFKQTLSGSDTRYTFHHTGNSGQLYVFEAPIDMLSYITMHLEGWQNHSYLPLDGLSSKPLHHFLALNGHITDVALCTDHDAAGIEAAGRLRDELLVRGNLSVSRLLPEHKDWNEDIKARRGLTAIPASEHPKIKEYRRTATQLKDMPFDSYYRHLTEKGLSYAIDTIQQDTASMDGNPFHWNDKLLRVSAVCGLAARFLGGGDILDQLASKYEPYTDRGQLKSHKANMGKALCEMAAKPDILSFTRLADACLRTDVYIKTDYPTDLERQKQFEKKHEQSEPIITLSI